MVKIVLSKYKKVNSSVVITKGLNSNNYLLVANKIHDDMSFKGFVLDNAKIFKDGFKYQNINLNDIIKEGSYLRNINSIGCSLNSDEDGILSKEIKLPIEFLFTKSNETNIVHCKIK